MCTFPVENRKGNMFDRVSVFTSIHTLPVSVEVSALI